LQFARGTRRQESPDRQTDRQTDRLTDCQTHTLVAWSTDTFDVC